MPAKIKTAARHESAGTGSSRVAAQEGFQKRRPIVYTQDACLMHTNIAPGGAKRSLERPERLYAVNAGVAAIYSRLEEAGATASSSSTDEDDNAPFTIVRSTATIENIPEHPAACTVLHIKSEDGPTYAQVLEDWSQQSRQMIAHRQRELPPHLEQDLYLCPKSFSAFKAAMGTVCEAVNTVAAASKPASLDTSADGPCGTRAFVAVRPPGHHCISGAPAGLGFVNTVVVGAVHAFYQHGYTHVIIFDIDLHHGNGTQKVVWDINAQRQADPPDDDYKDGRPIMFYGSIHDIQAYPCATGDEAKTAAASLSVQGEGGQWIENIHLQPYASDDEFWAHYEDRYVGLIERAEQFIAQTQAKPEKTMVLMSCGFSASPHEHAEMSTHGCYLPTAFYHRFTRDACALADRAAQGRLVSVLEGGYSNLALISGVVAHVAGLAETPQTPVDPAWWDPPALREAEQVLRRKLKRKAQADTAPRWLSRARQIADLLRCPLDPSADSPVLVVPPPDGLRPARAPLVLSAAQLFALGKGRAAGTGPAVKRQRTAQAETSASHRRSASTELSELTSVPETPEKQAKEMRERRASARGQTGVALVASSASRLAPASSGTTDTKRATKSANSSLSGASVSSADQSPQVAPASSSVAPIRQSLNPQAAAPSAGQPSSAQPEVQSAYAELTLCHDEVVAAVASEAALPTPVQREFSTIASCVRRLGQNLVQAKSARRALATLSERLARAHAALDEHFDEGEGLALDGALDGLEGAASGMRRILADFK
ncbi:arginase/deacetylase [Phanerochaete sordida]|uniref:Arginase/deacetylase n=1 Tax=Phanerochaete sordida TaxID=48140 RepID=A0A9P3LIX1_9APHY|nr:arginase/deacetylase [Phanerochaete sordida]